jgi:MFS transporter, PPP family, 3-phenylpropionic acid transporter
MTTTHNAAAGVGGALYFAYYAGAASLIPFLSLYLRSIGLSGSEIGVLVAIPPAMVFLGAGFWGSAADRSKRPLWVFRAATLISVVAALVIPVPTAVVLLAGVIAVYAFGQSGIVPLLDSMVLKGLGSERERYGRVRLWGAIGWGAAAAAVGVVIDAVGLESSFLMYGSLLLAAVGLSFAFPRAGDHRTPTRASGHLRGLLAISEFRVLLLLCTAEGVVFGILANYLFIHLQNMGASGTLLGLMLTAATVSEVVFFLLAPVLIRRFAAGRLVVAAVVVMLVRLLLYIPLTEPSTALAIQLLHGPGFALFIAAAVNRAGDLAPPGSGATAQGAVTATNFGLGAAIGAIGGGALLESLGTRVVLGAGAGTGFLLACLALVFLRTSRKR